MTRLTNEYVYEEVDYLTGEVIKSKRKATYKTRTINKKYGMISLADEWFVDLDGSDVLILMVMLKLENPNTWEVLVNKTARETIRKSLKISDSQITRSLRNMLKNNVLAKIERGVYLINPECVWIGSSEVHEKKVDNYMKYANLDHYLVGK